MKLAALVPALLIAACAGVRFDPLPAAPALRETEAVGTPDDAADDAAIWIDARDPVNSIILGTDKKAGLYLYGLDGAVRGFLPVGALNNIDLRQGVTIGDFAGGIAAASNRSDNTITLFSIDAGKVSTSGAFASAIIEPYGLCMGLAGGEAFVFVTYKTGDIVAYRLVGADGGAEAARLRLPSQLEGCVFDDERGVLYFGEEGRGIWKAPFAGGAFGAPAAVDAVGGPSGLRADVEGMAIYRTGDGAGYLIVSSQGDNSFAVYERSAENRFLGRFRVGAGAASDGAEETDGLEATSAALGPDFPAGLLIVQDGFNEPRGSKQNFKMVDWRAVRAALDLAE